MARASVAVLAAGMLYALAGSVLYGDSRSGLAASIIMTTLMVVGLLLAVVAAVASRRRP